MRILIASLATGLLASCGGGGYGGGGGSNPPATLTISVAPDTITLGGSATVTWNSNAPCTASGAWSGSKAMSGSEMVTPTQTGTLTYTLVCRGGGYGSSERESATLTVNAARVARLVTGDGCCARQETFPVIGIATDSGEGRFLLLDTHYVGKAGEAQLAYATCNSCLAGGLKTDPNQFKLVSVSPQAPARASIRVPNLTSRLETVEFTLPYDRSSGRLSGAAAVQGVYTTNLGTGYTLTIAVDSSGQVIGNDTNGCRLDGRVIPNQPAATVYDVALNVNACGVSDGMYQGNAALLFDGDGNALQIFLSASNPRSAIGWRLSR